MNFRENFKPTKEERIKRYEALLNINKKLIGNCCTCKHYKGIITRGIVTDYGECKLNNMLFMSKNCIDKNLNCDSYEENINTVKEIKKHIKELKGEIKMTVKDLIEELEIYDLDLPVYFQDDYYDTCERIVYVDYEKGRVILK